MILLQLLFYINYINESFYSEFTFALFHKQYSFPEGMSSSTQVKFQFEIAGLDKGDNGRHCDIHIATPCGQSVKVGDYVSINIETLENGDDKEWLLIKNNQYHNQIILSHEITQLKNL